MSSEDIKFTNKQLPAKISKIGYILLAIGGILGIIGFITDASRASFGYLPTFMYLISVAIGSLFLVALEYAANADWSTPFRRVSEFLAASTPFILLLSLPLLFNMSSIFHWTHTEVLAEDPILSGKSPYLNTSFFIIRTILFSVIWALFYYLLIKNSRKQDDTKDQLLTKKNIKYSVIFIPVFAITLTLSSVDWMMSIEPHWFSTIFGVYYFSGTVWVALAALTLIVVLLRENGYYPEKINSEHYYSLGTLLFAFTAFWGYIAFSQYMLIWYADLPEETSWFFHRWEGVWVYFSLILIVTHFVVPFFALLSYSSKTNAKRLIFVSAWVLVAHYIDLYWLIMPGMPQNSMEYSFSWFDLTFPIALTGFFIILFSTLAKKYNIIPIGDPKLKRGLDFHL